MKKKIKEIVVENANITVGKDIFNINSEYKEMMDELDAEIFTIYLHDDLSKFCDVSYNEVAAIVKRSKVLSEIISSFEEKNEGK